MIDFYPFSRFDPSQYNKEQIARNEANKDARARRLTPDATGYWIKVISTVAKTIPAGKKPCSYQPWQDELREYFHNPPDIGSLTEETQRPHSSLMSIARDIAQPGWPEPREDLIEFALVFLEADVMLFRSGYTKRHLIKRLQQSPLSKDHMARNDTLLRRAVTDGTGLEEFRAYRRLAAHLVMKKDLPNLTQWLEKTADGAILTMGRAGAPAVSDMLASSDINSAGAKLWSKVSFFGPSKWGLPFPQMSPAVPAGKRLKETGQQIKYNAYLMLTSIQRRQFSERNARAC